MCTSSFRRYPLSSSISVIHSLGFLVTSYSFYLEIFLRSLVLEAPVIGSNFIESFVHDSLASTYLFDFVLASSKSEI